MKNRNAINRQTFFDKHFPLPRKTVYLIKNELDEVVYVGESNNTPRRVAEHFGYDQSKAFDKGELDKDFKREFYSYEIAWEGDSHEERLLTEIKLEFKYKPKWNKRHGLE